MREYVSRGIETNNACDNILDNISDAQVIHASDEILLREELMWKQRSQITWLKQGDENTIFFHQKSTWESQENRIKNLKNEHGQTRCNQGEMETCIPRLQMETLTLFLTC